MRGRMKMLDRVGDHMQDHYSTLLFDQQELDITNFKFAPGRWRLDSVRLLALCLHATMEARDSAEGALISQAVRAIRRRDSGAAGLVRQACQLIATIEKREAYDSALPMLCADALLRGLRPA